MKTKTLLLTIASVLFLLVTNSLKAQVWEWDGTIPDQYEVKFGDIFYNLHPILGEAVVTNTPKHNANYNYKGKTELVIPASIVDAAYDNYPYKVTGIDHRAFYNAEDLVKITIPSSIEWIGNEAFYGSGIYNNSKNWFDGVLYIGNYLIEVDKKVEKLIVKEGTRLIANNSCYRDWPDNEYPNHVYLPNTVEYIGESAFAHCDIKTFYMSNTIKSIGRMAFIGCPIEEIDFPNTLEYIGSQAFRGVNLKDVKLPENEKYTTIVDGTFYNCKDLTTVTIPKTINLIESSAFLGCTSLKDIYCKGLVRCEDEAKWSFANVDLSNITLHIKERYWPFYRDNWPGFKYETERFSEDGINYRLNDEKKTGIVAKEKTGSDNYSVLKGVITIPKTITDDGETFTTNGIEEGAFSYSPIGRVSIEGSVIRVPKDAFAHCASLTDAVLPNSVTEIGENAFGSCSKLENIPGLTNDQTDFLPQLDKIGAFAFADCIKLPKLRLHNASEIGEKAFINCTSVTDITLGASVSKIGKAAFAGCTKLEKMTNLAAKPQPFPDKLFDGIDKAQFVIYVHRTAYEAFKAADGWKDYNIQIIPSEVQYFTIRLTVNDEKAGTVSGGGSYVEGTEVTVTATPKEGYHFVRWSDGETKASYSFKLTKDLSLQAIFEEDVIIYYYDLKLKSNDEKLGTVSGGGTHIEKGTVVPVTATPAEGCEFLYWVDANGAYWGKQTEWTVTKDETLTAHFRVIPDYDEYLVFVLGEQVTSANASDILDDGVWSYDRATHTLYTMKDATYKKENAGFIQDWETDLGAMTVVVNHQITAEVETTDNVGRWAIYGHKGMKFVGSKFKFIDVRALNMMAAHTLQPLEVSNHLRLFITEGNTTEYGKNYYSTPMIFSGTPAIKVNSASVRLSVGLGDKISNQTNEQIELTNAEINYGELNGQYLEILDQTPMYMVNYETEEAMNKCNVSGMGSYYPGEQVTLRALPETSYKFVRWSDGSTDNPYTFTMPAHDVLIDPVVEAEEIAPTGAFINADAPEGQGTIKDDFTGGWFEEGTALTITAIPEEDYNFVKWSDGNTDNPRIITVEAGKDITIHAEFAQKERFTVTFLDWDDEVLKEEKVYKGEDATVPDQPYRQGYTFTGWDKDYTNVTADLTVKAQFDINVYIVRFFDREDVQIGEDQHIEYGKAAVAPEAPEVEGFVFVDWSKFFDFVESDLDIYAIYDLQRFKAEFTAGEHGSLQVDLADLAAIPYGESILLIATPEEHYEIDKWSDGGTGDTRSIVVTSDTTVSVTFVKKKYMVTFIGFGGATIKYEYVTAGEGATAPDLPAVHGYHFVEWDTPFNEIWENTTVTAIYEEDPVNMPENLQVKLTEIEGDTQLDFTWDPLEGAVSYAVGFGYGDEQSAMIPTPTNSLTLVLSKFVKDYSVKPGTYTVRWFVAGMDAYSQPMGDWAEGESFQITVKDTGTGIDEGPMTNDQLPMTNKIIIDNQLYILIGEKMYDATGKLVQ